MTSSDAAFLVDEGLMEFPHSPKVSCYQCEYDQNYYNNSLFAQHEIEYPPCLDSAVTKRKAEFFAGRYAARRAFERLGAKSATVEIGKHRNPVWPDALIGSITHTATHAICAVALKGDYTGVGIDLENWVSWATATTIKDGIVTPDEAHVLSSTSLSFEQSLTLVFSAKESLFKALFPHVGNYFAFDAAAVNEIDVENNEFAIELTKDLSNLLVKGTSYQGNFIVQPSTVFTSIFIVSP